MLKAFDGLRDISLASINARMLLAVVCGGLIGLEREYKRRPAGFRTHILICLGASMTTLTGIYLMRYMNYTTDIERIGAQVIAGIGFIGAGAIIVTKRNRVKGLTTAAGLWAAAIVGLAVGAGFYEGVLLTTFLILVAELLFSKLEYRILDHVPEINLYIEYEHRSCLDSLLKYLADSQVKVTNLELTRFPEERGHGFCAVCSLQLKHRMRAEELVNHVSSTAGVLAVQEL